MKDYVSTLKTHFGFDTFRDKQLEIIDAILKDGRDVCAILFTGAGKSLCFQFPPVHTNKVAIVVSPLISLMNDQRIKLENMGIPSACLNSTIIGKNKIKRDVIDNKYRLVYITPEYLVKQEEFLIEIKEKNILLAICIDESHCISSWGSDFRLSYKGLSCLKDWFPNVPIMAFTATATARVQKDIINTLQLKDPAIIKTSFDRPNLYIKVLQKGGAPLRDLYPLIKDNEPSIIYCQTRKMTETLNRLLQSQGIKCNTYHAGMHSLERELVHESFINNDISCVVATVAFGMGIDKVIRKVVHYGMPKDMESYYQEIGRAGRDGKRSDCYLFYSASDVDANNYFINQIKNPTYRLHKMKLTEVMKRYIYTHKCRRTHILSYFGEIYSKDNCRSCDNCLNKKDIIMKDFTTEAILILTTIYETNNTYGIGTIINILRGSSSKKIPSKYKQLQVYGMGKYRFVDWWKIFSKMLMNIDFIKEKSIAGGYGFTLCRTLKAREWIMNVANGLNIKPNCEDVLILPLPKEMLEFYSELTDGSKPKLKPNKSTGKSTGKSDTIETTYDMFQNKKMSISKIAQERNCKDLTIEDHLIKLYQNGKKLDMNRLNFDDKIYKQVSAKIKQLNYPTRLREIKKTVPKISYLQIRLTQARMDKKEKIKVKPKKIKISMDNIDDSFDLDSFDLDSFDMDNIEEELERDLELALEQDLKRESKLLIDNNDYIDQLTEQIKQSRKNKNSNDSEYKKLIDNTG